MPSTPICAHHRVAAAGRGPLALGNVDGDADLDKLAGNGTSVQGGCQNRLYRHDGRGGSTDINAIALPERARRLDPEAQRVSRAWILRT